MGKAAFIIFVALLVLAGCSLTEQEIINNPRILAQLEPIITLSLMDGQGMVPLKRSDLDALNRSVASDPEASHSLEGLYWMLDHNETEHIAHTLGFLEEYLATGKESPCTPHELWHATLYIKHGDSEGAEHAIEDALASYPLWVAEAEAKREKFPQFYTHFDAQKEEAAYLIGQLRKGNYTDEAVGRIEALGEIAVC